MSEIVGGCPCCGRGDATSDGILVYCVRCGIYAPVSLVELVAPQKGFLRAALDEVFGRT